MGTKTPLLTSKTSNKLSELNQLQEKHNAIVAPNQQASYNRAINTKNPLSLSTFEERGASIAAKVDRLRQLPEYQKMSPEQQQKTRGAIYDKYVQQSYQKFGVDIPPKEAWVKLTENDAVNKSFKNKTDASSFYDDRSHQMAMKALTGADKTYTGIALFGAVVSNKIFQGLHGLDKSFTANLPQGFHAVNSVEGLDNRVQRQIDRFENVQKNHIDSVNYWLNTHYKDSVLNGLSTMAGEGVAAAPLYRAIGVGLSGLGAAGKVGTISAKLAKTTLGRWVSGTIKTSVDGYLSALVVSGGDKSEALSGAIGGAALHTGGAVGEKVAQKIASFSLIKQLTAGYLSVAGKPFAQDLTASAAHELTFPKEYFENVEREHAEYKAKTEYNPNVPLKHNEMHVGNGIILKPATESKGYIHYAGTDYPYANTTERQQTYSKVEKLAEQLREKQDPIMAQLHATEKNVLDSISVQMYKGKNYLELKADQQHRVVSQRLNLIDEAANELPVHMPKMVHAEVSHKLEQFNAANPENAEFQKMIEGKFKGKVADVVTANTIKSVAIETGIRNSSSVLNKLEEVPQTEAKIRAAENKTKKEYSRLESMGMTEEAIKTIHPKYQPGMTKEYEPLDGASAFHNFRKETLVYFKKLNRSERRASDNTLIGNRDKRSWNEIVKSDNRKEFVEKLKEADGGRIRFENDLHRMLFHYAQREGMDRPLKEKLIREIIKLKPKKVTEWGAKDIAAAADNTALHLYELAKSGKLESEGNMFKSTNINPEWSPTQWQMALHRENDTRQLDIVHDLLTRHPKEQKVVRATMQSLMDMKYETSTLPQYLELEKEINNISKRAMIQDVIIGGKAKKGRK